MRKLLLVCLSAALLFTSVKAQSFNGPGEYMSAFNNATIEMNKKYMAYSSAAAHGRRARKVEKMRKQVLESITNCRDKIIDLPMYKADNTLRKSNLDYNEICYNVFNDDYAKIVNIEEIAEQSFDGMQAYILLQEKTSERLKAASASLELAERAFAAKYNVNLVEGKDDLGEKMAEAAKLHHYINKVFLVFFKCNWQDDELTRAMNAKKINDMEQSRNSVIKYADEGLLQLALDSIRTFKGDPSLSFSCKQVLEFLKKTAENDIPKITDYFLKAENFEKAKREMESKGDSRTKDDVKNYNAAVNEFNAAVKQFNQLNANINARRHEVIENWNAAEKSFSDTHMPYYK